MFMIFSITAASSWLVALINHHLNKNTFATVDMPSRILIDLIIWAFLLFIGGLVEIPLRGFDNISGDFAFAIMTAWSFLVFSVNLMLCAISFPALISKVETKIRSIQNKNDGAE